MLFIITYHYGNFAHKVRAYTYLKALGTDGIKKMSAVAVLSARYIQHKLSHLPTLPFGAENTPRMHEFIVTLSNEHFNKIQDAGVIRAQAIARIGKLFLDFGFHAPTVAFPEQFGLMIEPTESFSKSELDSFTDTVCGIYELIESSPEVLNTVPHFTPIDRVDEVSANKNINVSESLKTLSPILPDRINPNELRNVEKEHLFNKIVEAHKEKGS
jgi:glycine dehydrogenase